MLFYLYDYVFIKSFLLQFSKICFLADFIFEITNLFLFSLILQNRLRVETNKIMKVS